MTEDLAATFEANRPRLQGIAFRMLGSLTEAEDAVQETWLRLAATETGVIENLAGWLTTVLSRLCLGELRKRRTRPEEPMAVEPAESAAGPEEEALLVEAMGPALLVVLEMLTPGERLAFVLHDLFGVTFDDIADIAGRSPAAARQLASRARRRVRESGEPLREDRGRQQVIVDAFLAASRRGDYGALLSMLDPDVLLRADRAAVEAAIANRDKGAPLLAARVRGANEVAAALLGRATAARSAVVEGLPGAVWAPGGRVRAAFVFRVNERVITQIEILTDSRVISLLDVEILSPQGSVE